LSADVLSDGARFDPYQLILSVFAMVYPAASQHIGDTEQTVWSNHHRALQSNTHPVRVPLSNSPFLIAGHPGMIDVKIFLHASFQWTNAAKNRSIDRQPESAMEWREGKRHPDKGGIALQVHGGGDLTKQLFVSQYACEALEKPIAKTAKDIGKASNLAPSESHIGSLENENSKL